MREILFRVWNTELKQYVQTDNTFINVNNGNVMEAQSIGNGYMLMIGSDKTHIVEQFTGLYDKNGTKIYEGDIVKEPYGLEWEGIVIFEKGQFIVDIGSRWIPMWEYIEVIGNIHEEDNNEKNNI